MRKLKNSEESMVVFQGARAVKYSLLVLAPLMLYFAGVSAERRVKFSFARKKQVSLKEFKIAEALSSNNHHRIAHHIPYGLHFARVSY